MGLLSRLLGGAVGAPPPLPPKPKKERPLKDVAEPDWSTCSTPPYQYQKDGVIQIEFFNGRALLGDEMGLGKTLQSLYWLHFFLKTGPVLIVCPAGLKYNWQRECLTHVQRPAEVLEGTTPRDEDEPNDDRAIYVINYDVLGEWLPFLKSRGFGLVIVDECHKLGNRSTKRTKAVRKICRGVKHVIGLSGTALTNRPAELFPMLNILRPDVFDSFYSFAARYCGARRKPWGWDYRGSSREKELHRLLTRTCLVRRQKKDVLKDLPAKQRDVVVVEIEDRKQYDKAQTDFITWLKQKNWHAADKAAKAERLVRAGYLKRLAGELKLKAVTDWVDEFLSETDEKLIVFGVHKKVLGPLYKRYHGKCVGVDGSVTGSKRQQAVDQFNNDRRCRLFFGNIEAAGVGWSSTAASTVLFAELDWVPGKHTQAEDRVHGIGRGVKGVSVRCVYLVGRETVEESLCKLLQAKQKVLDSVLDGKPSTDGLDVFNQLIRTLEET